MYINFDIPKSLKSCLYLMMQDNLSSKFSMVFVHKEDHQQALLMPQYHYSLTRQKFFLYLLHHLELVLNFLILIYFLIYF